MQVDKWTDRPVDKEICAQYGRVAHKTNLLVARYSSLVN